MFQVFPDERYDNRFSITHQSPAYEGKVFGQTEEYQQIDAIARIAVNPNSHPARTVVDIGLAPINEKGLVEFSTQVTILRPIHPSKSSSVRLYEVVNVGLRMYSLSSVALIRLLTVRRST